MQRKSISRLLVLLICTGIFQTYPLHEIAHASVGPRGSLQFSGSVAAPKQVVARSLSAPGTGEFTYETWVKTTLNQSDTATANIVQSFISTRSIVCENGCSIEMRIGGIGDNGAVRAGVATSGSGLSTSLTTGTGQVVANRWYHVAFVRALVSGTYVTSLYLDGVLKDSSSSITSNLLSTTAYLGSKGDHYQGGTYDELNGSISNIRISNTAEYRAAFTPPTEALVTTSQTQLLLNSTNDSNYVTNTGTKTGVTIDIQTWGITPTRAYPAKSSDSPVVFVTANILNEGSKTGWNADANTSINNSDGNPAPSIAFSKNGIFNTYYSDNGADFAGTEISFDVKFLDIKDHIMLWWGAAGGGTGSVKQLLLGPGTNSGQRLAGKGGLSDSGTYNGYYQTGTGTLTGTNNVNSWSINTWYTVKVVIGATSSSYYLNGTLIESKSTALPTAGYVAIGGDDRDGWGFTNGTYVDNISIKVPKITPTFSWANQTKAVGDANFRLTTPTPSTPGTFTYSSANTGVISLDATYTDSATVGVSGSSVITATFTPTDSASYTSATTTMTLTVNKQAQAAVVLSLSSSSNRGSGSKAITFSTTGGSDTGTVSYSVKSGGTASGCALSNSNTSTADTITATSTGTCLLQAVKAATNNYATETSTAVTFNFLSLQTFAYDSGTATSGIVPTGGTYYAGDTITVSSGSALSKPGFKLNGWKNSSNVSYEVGSTFTISTTDTLTAQWRQASLFGVADADLTEVQNWNVIDGFSAGGNISNGTNTFTVAIPANALPAGTAVKLYALSSSTLAQSKIGSGKTYILNMVVAWLYGQTVPTATSAITLKIESPSIKKDAVAYMIIGDTVTAVGTATQDGVINTYFTEDPIITVVNPVVQENNNNNNGGGGGGGGGSGGVEMITEVVKPIEVEKPITPVPVLAKSTQVTHKVFFGMNAAWINSANIKSLKSFLAKISSSNQISQITIDGFTQPTPINPNPLILSKARANSVAKLIKSQGVSAKIIKAGKGNEKVNKPSSRYVLVTVTSTVAG